MTVGIWPTEDGHIVNILPPVDITGGKQGDRFSMANYGHASIIVQVGVSAAAFTKIILNACTADTGGVATAIPYTLYPQETALGDVVGAKESVAATGRTPSANDGIFYIIELDARELPEDSKWVELSLTNTANACLASAIAILSAARYGQRSSPTTIV
jgi:hypothetical protein